MDDDDYDDSLICPNVSSAYILQMAERPSFPVTDNLAGGKCEKLKTGELWNCMEAIVSISLRG